MRVIILRVHGKRKAVDATVNSLLFIITAHIINIDTGYFMSYVNPIGLS